MWCANNVTVRLSAIVDATDNTQRQPAPGPHYGILTRHKQGRYNFKPPPIWLMNAASPTHLTCRSGMLAWARRSSGPFGSLPSRTNKRLIKQTSLIRKSTTHACEADQIHNQQKIIRCIRPDAPPVRPSRGRLVTQTAMSLKAASDSQRAVSERFRFPNDATGTRTAATIAICVCVLSRPPGPRPQFGQKEIRIVR